MIKNDIQKITPVYNQSRTLDEHRDMFAAAPPTKVASFSATMDAFNNNNNYYSHQKQSDLMNMAASAVNFTSNLKDEKDKMNLWKVLIRDDAARFQQETEDKKTKKKVTQADYKSYLDRQMEHARAQAVLEERILIDEATTVQSKVRRLQELEQERMQVKKSKARQLREDNAELNLKSIIHQREEREREQSRERQILAEMQRLEQEKLKTKLAKFQKAKQEF